MACHKTPEQRAWLERLPFAVRELKERWALTLDPPFDGIEGSCSLVAPAVRKDGTRAILKLGMPHMEARDEIRALRFLDGDPTVYLLESDDEHNAMLLEHCEPGTPLRRVPEDEQDVVIASLLRRFWRRPPGEVAFRPLSEMTAHWIRETTSDADRWPDAGLVEKGLRLMRDLSRPAEDDVLLATDLHAGNVLRARREPWLVIDPKPFVGDPAYDATQHLLNCPARMHTNPLSTIRRFGNLLDLDPEKIRLWMFARLASEPRDDWNQSSLALASRLA